MCPNATLEKLIDGNKRFAQGQLTHPNLGIELRNALVNKQKPYAAILACSDSRVPVEIIFDAGLGDLFVVRSAGHVLSKETIGSLEYAVGDLGVKLIVVMGHDNCGAVTSAMKAYKSKKYKLLSNNLQSIMNHIYPVFDNLNDNIDEKDLLMAAIRENIQYQVNDLINSDAYLARKIENKELIIIGAKYSLETGFVEFFEYDDRQDEIEKGAICPANCP